MADDPPGAAPRPDQFERREQPPALVAPQEAARDKLPGHRGDFQALPPEAAGDPQALPQLPDLRHAMHGPADRAAKNFRDFHFPELGKNRADAALNGVRKSLRPRRPGGFRARPHQPVAELNAEMIDPLPIPHLPL